MTPRQFLNSKFPEYEKERGKTGHDDIHQEKMMKEYADFVTKELKAELKECKKILNDPDLLGEYIGGM